MVNLCVTNVYFDNTKDMFAVILLFPDLYIQLLHAVYYVIIETYHVTGSAWWLGTTVFYHPLNLL